MTSTKIERRDDVGSVMDLAKPRITGLVVFTTAMGMWLAPGLPPRPVPFLLAVALLVASSNAWNCFLERHADARMERTRDRSLPRGRVRPAVALALAVTGTLVALPLVWWAANPLTAALGLEAFVLYVGVYTPMKRFSPWALQVGAVPGALPPLMGWTAVTGTIDPGGLALFGILFVWQIPHFLALSLLYRDDYDRGGYRVMSLVHGEATTRRHIVIWSAVVAVVSLAAVPMGLGGHFYALGAAGLSAGAMALAFRGVAVSDVRAWSRTVFLFSLIHLPALFILLAIDPA